VVAVLFWTETVEAGVLELDPNVAKRMKVWKWVLSTLWLRLNAILALTSAVVPSRQAFPKS
jgi:hypothetical protein